MISTLNLIRVDLVSLLVLITFNWCNASRLRRGEIIGDRLYEVLIPSRAFNVVLICEIMKSLVNLFFARELFLSRRLEILLLNATTLSIMLGCFGIIQVVMWSFRTWKIYVAVRSGWLLSWLQLHHILRMVGHQEFLLKFSEWAAVLWILPNLVVFFSNSNLWLRAWSWVVHYNILCRWIKKRLRLSVII